MTLSTEIVSTEIKILVLKTHTSTFYGLIIIDPYNDKLQVGLITQLVKHCTADVRVPYRPEFFTIAQAA